MHKTNVNETKSTEADSTLDVSKSVKKNKNLSGRRRKRGAATIVTSDEYIQELSEIEVKKIKQEPKELKRKKVPNKTQVKKEPKSTESKESNGKKLPKKMRV